MALTGSLCFVLGLATVALSQTSELTIQRKPGTQLKDDSVTIPFGARVVVGECDATKRVCGRISGHKETFTIPAGTEIQQDTQLITVSDDHTLSGDEKPLGKLAVKANAVEKDGVFTAPFLIAQIDPQIKYDSNKKETVVLLNGPMGNEPVDIQFAADESGSGEKFTLKVYTGTAAVKQFCLVPLIVVSTMLFT